LALLFIAGLVSVLFAEIIKIKPIKKFIFSNKAE